MAEEKPELSFGDSILEEVEKTINEKAVVTPEVPPEKPEVTPEVPPVVPSAQPPEELFGDGKPPGEELEEELKTIEGNEGLANLRTAYKNLKNELKQAQEKAQGLEGTLNEAKSSGDETEKLRTKMEAMSSELERVALERHPEFQQRFRTREEALDTMTETLVSEAATEELPKDTLTRLLKEPQSPYKSQRLNALADQVTPYLYSRLISLSDRFDELGAEKQSLLANHKETLEGIQAREKQSVEQGMNQQRSAFNDTMAVASQNLEFLREVDGNDEWNGKVREIKEQARNLYFEETSQQNLMEAAVLAATAGPYRSAYMSVRQQLKEALAELGEFKKAKPSIGSDQGVKTPNAPQENEDFGSFVGRAVATAHE